MGRQLAKAPLQEVMIELRWKLDEPWDPAFEPGCGLFWAAIREEFPVHVRINPTTYPDVYRVQHQYRKQQEDSTAIQLGHGVLTVSHATKGYSWEEAFFPFFRKTLYTFLQVYPLEKIEFNLVLLRYLDAVKIEDYGHAVLDAFLAENMNVVLQNDLPGYTARNLKIQQEFDVEAGKVLLVVNSGLLDGKTAITWSTTCANRKAQTPEQIEEWLNVAHKIQGDLFVKVCKPNFYASFQ